jgi:hypothetical protein
MEYIDYRNTTKVLKDSGFSCSDIAMQLRNSGCNYSDAVAILTTFFGEPAYKSLRLVY